MYENGDAAAATKTDHVATTLARTACLAYILQYGVWQLRLQTMHVSSCGTALEYFYASCNAANMAKVFHATSLRAHVAITAREGNDLRMIGRHVTRLCLLTSHVMLAYAHVYPIWHALFTKVKAVRFLLNNVRMLWLRLRNCYLTQSCI